MDIKLTWINCIVISFAGQIISYEDIFLDEKTAKRFLRQKRSGSLYEECKDTCDYEDVREKHSNIQGKIIEYMVEFKCSQMCPNAISVPCSYHIKESKWEDITTLELTEISLTCGEPTTITSTTTQVTTTHATTTKDETTTLGQTTTPGEITGYKTTSSALATSITKEIPTTTLGSTTTAQTSTNDVSSIKSGSISTTQQTSVQSKLSTEMTTTSLTTNIQLESSTISTEETSICTCPCSQVNSKWSFLIGANYTFGELKELLKDDIATLEKELSVDASSLSASINKKISALDERQSSERIGYIGIIMIVVPLALMVLLDLGSLFRR